jgi:hypothetical protein
MIYDLSNDFDEISALLDEDVDVYRLSRGRDAAGHRPVNRVELAFLCGDRGNGPSLSVDFDTRPDAEPDGDADHRCIAQLQLPRWTALMFPPKGDRTLRLTFPGGSVHEGTADDLDQFLARFLASTLRSAHADGVFDRIAADPSVLRLTLTYIGNPVWEHGGRAA